MVEVLGVESMINFKLLERLEEQILKILKYMRICMNK